jgi:acetyl esterase/lipase
MRISSDAPVGPPPPFDPELAAALAAVGDLGAFTAGSIPAMRRSGVPPRVSDDELRRGGVFEVEERPIPGSTVSLLICRPTAATGRVPVLYYIHPGGMVLGDNRLGVRDPLDWAEEFGLAVVSVEYRLAPEHPHPAPAGDCYAGLEWTASHAGELGLDPDRIIVVGGSAGGGLSAAVALMARDRGGPALLAQMLLCPMLDDRNDSPSSRQMAGLGVWDRAAMQISWTALLGDACGGPDVSPYAAPARATDLSGLPPAYIDVGSAETFRDEDVAYAARIWQAGGQAELHVWPGAYHGFEAFAPGAALTRDAGEARVRWLRRVLTAPGTSVPTASK